jgi:hypothetical protein
MDGAHAAHMLDLTAARLAANEEGLTDCIIERLWFA